MIIFINFKNHDILELEPYKEVGQMENLDLDFDKAWRNLEPSVRSFLKNHLRPSEMEDGLQIARVHLFLALRTWDPSRSQLKTYLLNILKHRLRDIIRFRYPLSVTSSAIEDQRRRSHLENVRWFSIDNPNPEDSGDNFEIASDEESVEDVVVDNVFNEKFHQDLLEIICSSAVFTKEERSILLKFIKTGSAPLNRKPRALLKLKQQLEARGYRAEDFF